MWGGSGSGVPADDKNETSLAPFGSDDDERGAGGEHGGGFDQFAVFGRRGFFLPEDPVERETAICGGAGVFELEGELRAWFQPDAEA